MITCNIYIYFIGYEMKLYISYLDHDDYIQYLYIFYNLLRKLCTTYDHM